MLKECVFTLTIFIYLQVPAVTRGDIATIMFLVEIARECKLSERNVGRAVDCAVIKRQRQLGPNTYMNIINFLLTSPASHTV